MDKKEEIKRLKNYLNELERKKVQIEKEKIELAKKLYKVDNPNLSFYSFPDWNDNEKEILKTRNKIVDLEVQRFLKIKDKDGNVLFETTFDSLKDIKVEISCSFNDTVDWETEYNTSWGIEDTLFELLRKDEYCGL